MGRRPDRFCFAQTRVRDAGGVIDHVHQASLRTALLVPSVEAAVQLHQFAKMLFPRTTVKMRRLSPACAHPQSVLQHPAAQRFLIEVQPVFLGQMLGRQSRTEARLPGTPRILLT
jgi:hypothetical protein